MKYDLEIKKLQRLFDQTIRLISFYKRHGQSIPFALKGNLGEFMAAIELMSELQEFQECKVNYRGGASPVVDINIADENYEDRVRIQVKTQIKHRPEKYYDFESSPTIKNATIANKRCHIIVLQILYPDNSFRTVEKTKTYVFDQNDFKHFSHVGCWTGKSKGDYTIYNILKVFGEPPPKTKVVIDHYNTETYHGLFKDAKDNWDKVKKLL